MVFKYLGCLVLMPAGIFFFNFSMTIDKNPVYPVAIIKLKKEKKVPLGT